MKTMMGGKGGYGGISTMNTDQREGRYKPHNNVTLYTRYSDNVVEVSCRDCGQKWEHTRGYRSDTPAMCEPVVVEARVSDEGDGVIFETYVTENNEIRYRPIRPKDDQC